MKRADSLIEFFIRDLNIEDDVRLAGIRKNWPELFQKPLSCHMSPSMLSGGELLLNVDSPAWLQELNYYKEDIRNKLSSYGIRLIRFRLGKVSTNIKSRPGWPKSKLKTLTTQELSYIERESSRVDDEAIRGTIKNVLKKAIASGKTKVV